MSKEIYISSTPHETRLAIVEKDELSEIYYERENEYTLAGSIYNGRVTRVLPGMQSAFVDVGLERDAFLYITDFLEEQGDSADFEGGEGRRQAGGERGQERSERTDHSDRADRSDRQDRADRPDRPERGRGRGGERGGDRASRGGEREPARELSRESQEAQQIGAFEPSGSSLPGGDRGEDRGTGEDDAAAEGSRTWRGRRGRRRGRGERAVAPQASEHGQEAASEPASEFVPHAEAEREALESVHGQAATEPYEREARSRGEGREGRSDRGGRGRDRGDRGGRDRGDRGDRDRGDRGRGHEPAYAAGDTPEAEPFILPGESLSKYRRGEASEGADSAQTESGSSARVAARGQASALRARPSTEIDLANAGWDGGLVLPGETLSRRHGGGVEAQTRHSTTSVPTSGPEPGIAEDFSATEAAAGGRNRRRDRDRRRGRGGDRSPELAGGQLAEQTPVEGTPSSFRSGAVPREELSPAEAVQPAVSSAHEPEVTELPLAGSVIDLGPEDASDRGEDLFYVPSTDVAPEEAVSATELAGAVQALYAGLEASPVVAHAADEAPEHFHEETTEFEPGEDASVSYRVDPASPSEFRQGGTAGDDDLGGEDESEAGGGDPDVQADYAGTEPQYTTLDAGEMLSELPGEVAIPGATEDPTNPIEHETAVLSEHLGALDGPGKPADAASEATEQTFAPGEGQLEEELLDDEDEGEVFGVTASYGEDTEEEVLEAGAEIGSLVRERALDQLARVELAGAEEEEDDFELDEDMEEDELEESEEVAGSEISLVEEEEAVAYETRGFDEDGERPDASTMGDFPEFTEPEETEARPREGRAERGHEVRRGGRDRGGRDRGGRGGDRRGMANSRSNGRPTRHSLQNTDLPAISDLLKPGQEVLVQIAKEPIAKKGARITSHIALPGRFLVFMPTVNHVGVSRKIESDGERRRLKEILLSEKGEAAGGFIVRTAAMGASEEELRSDLRFLLNLWADIKQRSETSKSPALIYHDLNLVERILRDQVTDNFSAIWVDTETEYERVLRFLQRFQPSLMRRVKLYTKDTPLFEQFGISEEINKALRSKVWLKSGGSIVINQTEALVAIDINTGKYVGKTARLEDTIVKTNLDAIPEIVRQIRLRDLGGIIVIDFIDMDDRKNRQKVLAALEEELKNDRAPSKVLQFNDFGLVAITRKRVKQSLERTLSTTCGICAGTGMVKSPITVCNEIYIELRKMHKQLDKGDVMLRVNPEVVKQLKSNNAKWLQEMEEISGKTILVKSDPSLHPEQFDIH